jgi:hypothetical protein
MPSVRTAFPEMVFLSLPGNRQSILLHNPFHAFVPLCQIRYMRERGPL